MALRSHYCLRRVDRSTHRSGFLQRAPDDGPLVRIPEEHEQPAKSRDVQHLVAPRIRGDADWGANTVSPVKTAANATIAMGGGTIAAR